MLTLDDSGPTLHTDASIFTGVTADSLVFSSQTPLFYLYRSSFVNFYFSWNMHYDTHQLQHQQQMIVRFQLEPLMRELAGRKQPCLRGLFDK
jgi:hypothetical protein